jgi:hypothetical protein
MDISTLIGDVPVSEQLGAALEHMASKEQVQALCDEVKELKRKINVLTDLVGDESVAVQIGNAIKNIKEGAR